MRNLRLWGVLVTCWCVAALGSAQGITVRIDGQLVRFQGTQPQRVQGRVMVPLRGIFEALGANVEWVAATRTAIAQKGNVDLQITIGEPIAKVNAREILLDVPAAVIRGATMVPLRFIGEALGAEVEWEGATQTVKIATSRATIPPPATTPPPTGEVSIASIVVRAPQWVRTGDNVVVELTGSPGGRATFQIPGVAQDVAMREVAPGRYVGTWTPGALELSISDAVVLAQLSASGKDKLIQAGRNVSVDTVSPKAKSVLPEQGRIVGVQPSIAVVFEEVGSGIDPASLRLTVNGANFTSGASMSNSLLTFVPAKPLSPGENDVRVQLADRAGNLLDTRWTFTVADASSILKSFTHDGDRAVEPGDTITFRLEGEAGGVATFGIGSKVMDRRMTEQSPGVYVGEYVIRKGDAFDQNDAVTVSLRTSSGRTYSTEAAKRLGVNTGPLSAPVVTSHAANDKVKGSVVLKGTGPAGATVRVEIEYTTMLLGALRVGGKVWEGSADVDEKGVFETKPIDLDTFLAGSNTEYTVRLKTVSADGRESEVTTLVLKKG